jgi:hypothetical protein
MLRLIPPEVYYKFWRKNKTKSRNKKKKMAAKKCLICNSPFVGRKDAKTCSAKCRKRLQKVRWSFYAAPVKKQLAKTLLLFLVGGLSALIGLVGIKPVPAHAATSSYLNFQSRLLSSSGSVIADGNYNIEFKIYRSLSSGSSVQGTCVGGGTDDCLWMETRTSGNKVRVVNGYMSVNLGSVTSFGSINWDQQLYLSMNIGGTGSPGWDGEMTPRVTMTALPYAFRAGTLAKTDGSGNVGTLSFNTTANNPAILLPDASGTVCLQSSASCGFAASSGSTSYIQNSTSLQSSANFNIQSASSSSIGGIVVGASGQSVDIFQVKADSIANPLFSVGSTGASKFINSSDSTAAFQIQKSAASDTLFTADTTNNKIVIGNATGTNTNTTLLVVDSATADPSTGYAGAQYYNSNTGKFRCYTSSWGDCDSSGSGATSVGTYSSSNHYNDGAQISSNVLTLGSADATHPGLIDTSSQTFAGAKTFQSTSTTALQVQSSGGSSTLLTADTSNMKVEVNGGLYSKGLTWTSRSASADNQWESITYGNGLFVSVACGVSATSCNATSGNRVMTSPDSINWTSRSTPSDDQWESITYGNGLFVGVATNGTNDGIMTSPDGITWTSRTEAVDRSWRSVTYGNGKFVAVGDHSGANGSVMTSSDGINWTSQTAADAADYYSVTYGNGVFVAGGVNGTAARIMTSPDGITWTSRTSAIATTTVRSIVFGNGVFAAATLGGVETSPDGTTWTDRSGSSGSSYVAITYGNGLFVGVKTSASPSVATSPDGTTWTSRTGSVSSLTGITYGNGMFVAVGGNTISNRVMTSGAIETIPLSLNNIYQGGITVHGDTLLQSGSNSTTTFQVQNTSSRNIIAADTSSSVIQIGNSTDGSTIVLGANGNANATLRKNMNVTGTVAANDVVEIDISNAGKVQQAAANSTKVFGIASSGVTNAAEDIVVYGTYQVNADATAVSIGDLLVTSSTAGKATPSTGSAAIGTVVGRAMSSKGAGIGTVWVSLTLEGGGSDTLQTAYNNSSAPATITSTDNKNLVFNLADTATDSSYLVNLQCATSCGANGKFAVQSASTDVLSVAPNGGTVSVGIGGFGNTVQIGNTTGAVSQTINIGTNSTGSSTNNVNIGSSVAGTTAITGATTITNRTSGSADTLVVNNSTSTGTIAKFQDNGTSVFSLADGGAATFQNQTNISTAFQIQNSGGAQLLNVDTTNPVSDLTTNSTANLVTNGSIEDGNGTTGWAIDGASVTLAQSSTQKYIGNNSLSITTPASTNRGAKYALTTTTLATNTQYTLTLSARLGSSTAATNPTSISTFDIGRAEDGSTESTCLSAQTITTTGWTTLTCTFTTATTSSTPYIFVRQSDATARTFYIDGVQLSRSFILQNYSIEQTLSASNWQKKSGTETAFAQDTGQFYIGTNSLKVTTQASANQGVKQNITLSDSTTYSLNFYAFAGTALSTMEAGYSSDGSTDNTVCLTAQTIDTTIWTKFSCTFTTPSSHSGTPYIYIKNTAAAIRTWYMDDIELKTGNYATAYREGTIALNGIVNSPSTFQNQTDSTTSFQIQNTSGNTLFNVDTLNNNITLLGGGNGDIQPWQTNSSSGYSARVYQCSTSANGYYYSIGGADSGSTPTNTVQYAKLNANGSLGNWATTTSISVNGTTQNRLAPACAVANGYIYVVAGDTTSDDTTATSTTYYAKLYANGTIGSWAATTSIPAARVTPSMTIYNGYAYVIGGYDNSGSSGTFVTTLYYAKLNADGTVGSWTTSTMPADAGDNGSTVINGILYIAGNTGSSVNGILYSRLGTNGAPGTFSSATAIFPTFNHSTGVFSSNGYLYVAGGYTSAPSRSTFYAKPSSTGDITALTTSNQLIPDVNGRSNFGTNMVVANGYTYIIGGAGASFAAQSTQYYTSLSRSTINGNLDLVGLTGGTLADGGAAGGELTAGNTTVVGSLGVRGNTTINQSLRVGDNLTVGGSASIQNTYNSSTAFQIQNASGVSNIQVTTVNLVANSTFETGTINSDNTVNGWAKKLGSETSIKTQNSNAQFGSDSLEVVTTTTTQQGALYTLPLAASTQYTFSFYAKVSSGSFATLTFGRSDTGASAGETNCVTTGSITTTYARFSCTFTTGATMGASGIPYLYFSKGTDASVRTIYIDGVMLEAAAAATTYREADINFDGQITYRNSADSTTAFQIQNAAALSILAVDTTNKKVTIAGTDTGPSFADLLLNNAHFTSTQTTKPTIGTPSNCGTGSPSATVANNSTDSAGSITITTGTTPTTCDTIVTFRNAYGTAPKSVILTGTSAVAGARDPGVSATSTTTFTVVMGTSGANTTAYTFYYWVVE